MPMPPIHVIRVSASLGVRRKGLLALMDAALLRPIGPQNVKSPKSELVASTRIEFKRSKEAPGYSWSVQSGRAQSPMHMKELWAGISSAFRGKEPVVQVRGVLTDAPAQQNGDLVVLGDLLREQLGQ